MNTFKPWLDEASLRKILATDVISNDQDVADFFTGIGLPVSRRAITDARNSFGIPAKTKTDLIFDVELEELEPPKILFIDIETRPNLGYFWRLYDENIGINQLVEEHQLLSFAAKWRGREEVEFYSEYAHGHEGMVKAAHDMLDEADFVVHWNGQKFDVPHLNKEFILLGMKPPSSYKQIDLLLTARKQFKFVSNKLQHVSTALGLPGKVQHNGFELWIGCMNNDPKSWEEMEEYNRQDTVLLEDIYNIVLPWIKGHPNVPLYTGVGKCPNCASENVTAKGIAYLTTRTYEKFQCDDCGAWMRGTKNQGSAGHVPVSY